jgi:hypothetical protein
VKSYNTSVTNFDRSVVPQGRKFAGLAIGDEDEMEGTAPTIDSDYYASARQRRIRSGEAGTISGQKPRGEHAG